MAEQPEASIPAARDLWATQQRGRTAPIDAADARSLLREGVALFNGARYWHAHETWETLWRAAAEDDRAFYQGLIQVAAGLLHLQRRNARGARAKLTEGIAKLEGYMPSHRGIVVTELVRGVQGILADLESGFLPYLIPPVIRYADFEEPDFTR
ncbi:MAG: hypothetical protein DLM71_05915 [Chloroflexi bacterium]|nr:MAG: hypothetical protein DLM71_05915 [Chloroflexota bacterium]